MIRCFLSTSFIPFFPYCQFDDWFRFDIDMGYNSCGLLMRLAYTSDQLTDAENAYEIEQAIDKIIANDPLNIYKKLKMEVEAGTTLAQSA